MHIMIDLETMGTRPDAPIISIGAVAFTAAGITHEFYRVVSLRSAVEHGGVIDPSTVVWWLKQSDEARAGLDDIDSVGLDTALQEFSQFLFQFGDDLSGVWGNGASFDNVLMQESGRRCGVFLWQFWKDRCYRTVKNMFPGVPLVRSGTHHNALDDARTQAEHLIAINDEFGNFL